MILGPVVNIIMGILKSIVSIVPFFITAATPPEGIIIQYLKFCLYSSIFITLFLLGGLVTPFIGLVYMYYIFYKKIKCYNKNIPDSKCV